jgi:hypothetical protein
MAGLAKTGDERSVFILAVGTALLLTPIEWLHYSLLLAAVVALVQPRLGFLWLLPLAFWTPAEMSTGEAWRLVLGLSITVATLGLALRMSRREITVQQTARPTEFSRCDARSRFWAGEPVSYGISQGPMTPTSSASTSQ